MNKIMRKLAVCVTICLVAVFALCGCGGPTPTETADTFLSAVKSGDTETIKTVYDGGSFNLLSAVEDEEAEEGDEAEDDNYFEEILLPKLQDFNYELSNEKIDGNKATVDVKITTYDIGSAFSSFMSEYFTQALTLAFDGASEEQIEKLANTLFETEINKLKKRTYSETVTLDLVKKDDTWKVAAVDGDSSFLNALTGNMIKTLENLEEAYSFDE